MKTNVHGDVYEVKVGGFEFELADIFSSPLFFRFYVFSGLHRNQYYWKVSDYIILNLSSFVTDKRRVQGLIWFWRKDPFLRRDLHRAIEQHHLVGHFELVLEWFGRGPAYLNRLDRMIRLDFIERRGSPFMDTILDATNENNDFLKHVNQLLDKAEKAPNVAKIQSTAPEDIPRQFGRDEIAELTSHDVITFTPEQMGAFPKERLEMFRNRLVIALEPEQVQGIKVENIPEDWIRSSLPLDRLSSTQFEDIIMEKDIEPLMRTFGDGPNEREGYHELMERLKPKTREFIDEFRAEYDRLVDDLPDVPVRVRVDISTESLERMREEYRRGTLERRALEALARNLNRGEWF